MNELIDRCHVNLYHIQDCLISSPPIQYNAQVNKNLEQAYELIEDAYKFACSEFTEKENV